MDYIRIGKIIRNLRKKKEMTQSQLADVLNISNKTISKWECGLGCPDISLLSDLSEFFGCDISHLLNGNEAEEQSAGGNMKNTEFYICPICGNISFSTGEGQFICCGRKIEAEKQEKAVEKLNIKMDDDEWYITSSHPMDKDNYISFIAFATGGSLFFYKTYPEWDLHLRMPKYGHGKLFWFSTTKGLFYQYL